MTIDEIIKYVFESPENTNANVLRSMLEELINSSNNNPGPIDVDLGPGGLDK